MSEQIVRSVPFKFQLGDLTLFSVSRRLDMRSVPLRDAIVLEGPLAPPHITPPPDSDGYAVRGHPTAGDLQPIARAGNYIRYVPLRYQHCYIDLATTFDQYQTKFSSKTRSTIKRKIAKFKQNCGGTLRWNVYRTPAELEEFFGHARAVSRLTYQERLLDAGLPDSQEFRATAGARAAADKLRAFLLFDGDKPVSYLYCPVEDGIVVYAYLGYDPAYARLSVGTILQWLALESLFGECTFRLFDFTEGQSEHKRFFATHERECANVFWLADTLGNRLLVHAHESMNRVSSWLGGKLDALGVKAKIRHLLRRN